MSNTIYNPGDVVSIAPPAAGPEGQEFGKEFAALVKVVSSRYFKLEYPASLGYSTKIAIKWVLESTKGNQFEKVYSTGLAWDATETTQPVASISPDGKRLIAQSSDYKGYKTSSDALYLLRKAISSGFPAEKITDDVSVFEGHCFFLTTDTNPGWKGSSKKAYPKQYHPEGWEAAKSEALARQAQKAAGSEGAAPQAAKAPPKAAMPQLAFDVATEAGKALLEIVGGSGGAVTRIQIPGKLNEYADAQAKKGNVWGPKLRQEITLALWDLQSLALVVSMNPALKMEGEAVSLK